MRLYEMLERVSEVVYQDNPSPLLTYLKNTLDDDGCFLRSRYGRRHEGEVADRELGEVGIEIAKQKGVYKGRKPIEYDMSKFAELYGRWKAGAIKAKEFMSIIGLKPNTFFRAVHKFEELQGG